MELHFLQSKSCVRSFLHFCDENLVHVNSMDGSASNSIVLNHDREPTDAHQATLHGSVRLRGLLSLYRWIQCGAR